MSSLRSAPSPSPHSRVRFPGRSLAASPGDRERALELLALALDVGQRTGMKKLVKDCEALMAPVADAESGLV